MKTFVFHEGKLETSLLIISLPLWFQYPAALMNLGAILHLNGRLQKAEANYLRALQLKPDDVITQSNLRKLWNIMEKQGLKTSKTWHRRAVPPPPPYFKAGFVSEQNFPAVLWQELVWTSKMGAEVTGVTATSGSIHSAVGTAVNTKKGNIGNLLKDVIVTHRTIIKPEHLKQILWHWGGRWAGSLSYKFCSFLKANLEIILFLKHCERKSECPFSPAKLLRSSVNRE